MEESQAHLLSLPEELLLSVLQHAGARALARAAVLCRRLRAAKETLSQRPAFASAMVIVSDVAHAAEDAAEALAAALDELPATADFALAFCANFPAKRGGTDPLAPVLECLSRRMPPGTQVAGCSGRGIFGILPGGEPAEIDPSTRQPGISLLLGRVPGARAHAFSCKRPEGGWSSEAACRDWMGLDRAAGRPISLHLFTSIGCAHLLEQCLVGLDAAFPGLVVTGGIASGLRRKDVFAFTAGPQLYPDVPGEAQYAGLALCLPAAKGSEGGGAAPGLKAGAFNSRGLGGVGPVFYDVGLVRGVGSVVDEEGDEIEMLIVSAASAEGAPALAAMAQLVEEFGHADLALWAADRAGSAGYASCLGSGQPHVVIEGMSHHTGVLGAVRTEVRKAFGAILGAAEQPSRVLCCQILATRPEGYLRKDGEWEMRQHVPAMLAECSTSAHGKAPHASRPATKALVVVSCTAKGSSVYEKTGVEAGVLHEASAQAPLAGVYCDGEIGPAPPRDDALLCGVRWGGQAAGGAPSHLQGFTSIVSLLSAGA